MVTLIANTFSMPRPPESVVRTRMLYEAFVSKSKTAFDRRLLPAIANDALSPEPAPATRLYVNVSPASGSVVDKAPIAVPTGEFSAMVLLDKAMSVGA